MNDKDFDFELRKFMRNGGDKVPEPYCESVEIEIKGMVASFNDHYATVSLLWGDASVDDFLVSLDSSDADPAEDTEDAPSPLFVELDKLVQKDIENFPILTDGEMQVSGEGAFLTIIESEEQSQDGGHTSIEIEIVILELGQKLTGDILYYSAGPMVSFEVYMHTQHDEESDQTDYDDLPNEVPSLLLHMENAKIKDKDGVETEVVGEVVVPLCYPSLKFGKIVHPDIKTTKEEVEEQPIVDITSKFTGDFIVGIYNEVERDVNYGGVEGEALHALRAKYQAELAMYMEDVDRNQKMLLTALNVMTHTREYIDVTDQEVFYLDPVIVRTTRKTWCVAHSFEIHTDKGMLLAHVLSENIVKVRYGIEE
ncbi:MAG: hypothetical protein ACOH18_02145 [Candidatus Saccharimonadaceae bacterium]